MARIRTIKPEFFKHGDLFDSEQETGLPLRLAFAGIWCLCDREGRFRWKPREMKLDVIPYDDVDFSRVLDALATRGFLVKYQCEGVMYGWVPTFTEHQVINNREAASTIPAFKPEMAVIADAWLTRAPRVDHAPVGEGKGREGKGREVSLSKTDSEEEQEEDRQPSGLPENSEGVRWYEEEGYKNKKLAKVAAKVASTRIRSKSNPLPYRNITEDDAQKVLEALEPCPSEKELDSFWVAWEDFHRDRTKPPYKATPAPGRKVAGVAYALADWASRRAGVWATQARLQGGKSKAADYERPPVWTPGGAA